MCQKCYVVNDDSIPFWENSKQDGLIPKILEKTVEDICSNYCKYPDQWDEEKEGCELSESEICLNCPLNRLT